MDYSGTLRLDDQPPLPATLRFSNDDLMILANAESIGTWPLRECQITTEGADFRLALDGEEAFFTAEKPAELEGEVERRWPSSVESPPVAERKDGSLLKWLAGGVGLILLAMVIGALMARDRPASVLLTSVPTTAPSMPAVFTAGVDQIPALWNEAASRLNLDLFLLEQPGPNRLQMNVRSHLTLYATEAPSTGATRSLMLAAAPTASAEEGDAVLASWGILIATVNPELDGLGRRQVLTDLGADPARPLTAGLDEEVTVGLATYRLQSGVLGGKALLTVLPAAGS